MPARRQGGQKKLFGSLINFPSGPIGTVTAIHGLALQG